MNLGLGIDTGGTYTDSVILDMRTGDVLAKAKALTTRDDLTVGIMNSIDKLDMSLFGHVKLVSVSSTLATNSIVEGKGCRVGLMTVGNDFERSVPVDFKTSITGGHRITGKERDPLDEDSVREFIENNKGQVDAFAISSYFSVRNPEHEIRIKEIIAECCDLPVVCGHELSLSLGFQERTVTAIFNARLIPIIRDLLLSVKHVLSLRDIKAPLMIVKGDGSIMNEAVALQRPIETILSGPAASMMGAKFLTELDDAIVVDMGGTTTDIGIMRGGYPNLDPEGAIIGGQRTRVKATDIYTAGIGGDSRIVVNDNNFQLTSLRVVPLCIGAHEHPELLSKLEELEGRKSRPQPSSTELASLIQEIEFFRVSRDVPHYTLNSHEHEFVEAIRKGPMSIPEVGEVTGIHPLSFNISRLEGLGIIQRIGLTPTDILHASGEYMEYDARASRSAVKIQSKKLSMKEDEFCQMAKEAVVNKVAREVAMKLILDENGQLHMCPVAADLLDKMVEGKNGADYGCQIIFNKPIIGIGAPVESYYPKLREKFSTDLILPDGMEVGNAIGAITGSVMEKYEILIKPKKGMGLAEDPPSILYSKDEMREFESLSDALTYAREVGESEAMRLATEGGADSCQVQTEVEKITSSAGGDSGGRMLLEAKVVFTAFGKPRQFLEA